MLGGAHGEGSWHQEEEENLKMQTCEEEERELIWINVIAQWGGASEVLRMGKKWPLGTIYSTWTIQFLHSLERKNLWQLHSSWMNWIKCFHTYVIYTRNKTVNKCWKVLSSNETDCNVCRSEWRILMGLQWRCKLKAFSKPNVCKICSSKVICEFSLFAMSLEHTTSNEMELSCREVLRGLFMNEWTKFVNQWYLVYEDRKIIYIDSSLILHWKYST